MISVRGSERAKQHRAKFSARNLWALAIDLSAKRPWLGQSEHYGPAHRSADYHMVALG